MIRLLALGDSYTIGEAVDSTDCWPTLLSDMLRRKGKRDVELTILARSGWTSEELAAGIDSERLDGHYDLVILLIGANDQYQGRSHEEYRPHFRDLLHRAIHFVCSRPSRVIVLSIPDWGATPFARGHDRAAIASAIDRLNAINMEESHRLGLRYVDVTAISREALCDESLLARDGLHPSAKMYERWAAKVAPIACDLLKKD